MCAEARRKARRAANPEAERAAGRRLYAADLEKSREKARRKRGANPNACRQASARWARANRDWKRSYRRTPLGQLRGMCEHTAKRLSLNHLPVSKLHLLGYAAAEWRARLESTLPAGWDYETAKAHGWHIDHIAPIAQVLDFAGGDAMLAFVAAMRLENLQMLPASENVRKSDTPAPEAFVERLLTDAKEVLLRYIFLKPKSILNLIPGLSEKPKAPKVPSVDKAQADTDKAADEAARKLRAREKIRAGAAASMTSGTSSSAFAGTSSSKPSLLG